MNTIDIRFGGFYESLHDDRIKNAAYDTDDMGEQIDRDVPPEEWEMMRKEYSIEYVKFLNEELDTGIVFDTVFMAQPYKGPDMIFASCSAEDINKIVDKAYTEHFVKLAELIVDICTRRDGYIPYYSVPELMADRERLCSAALEILILEELNDEWEYYFDRHSVYDNLRQ